MLELASVELGNSFWHLVHCGGVQDRMRVDQMVDRSESLMKIPPEVSLSHVEDPPFLGKFEL